MDLTLALKAIIMGIVEGLTEFLPISSTGHLILTADLLNFTGDKVVVFEIAIQCGALLAVIWEYRVRMMEVINGLPRQAEAQRFTWKLLVAFFPAVILGLLFGKQIQALLFTPLIVAMGFIVGGLAILWVERAKHAGKIVERVRTVDEMTVMDALKIGLIQSLALIPGTSRSGASIIGGLWVGLSRTASTEFSFFLAIPTLLGATVYSLYGHRDLLSMADLPLFTVGTVSAAISGFVCVRWLLRYIGHHDFTAFAWYRIAFGIVVLVTAYSGMVDWSQ